MANTRRRARPNIPQPGGSNMALPSGRSRCPQLARNAGVGLGHAGIHVFTLARNQPHFRTFTSDTLECLSQHITVAESVVSFDREVRVIGNFAFKAERAEPTIGKIRLDFSEHTSQIDCFSAIRHRNAHGTWPPVATEAAFWKSSGRKWPKRCREADFEKGGRVLENGKYIRRAYANATGGPQGGGPAFG